MATEIAKRRALITFPSVNAGGIRDGAASLLTGEWRWPLVVALLLVAALDVPFRVAELVGPAYGQVFSGMIWSPHDAAQYFSAMRQGAISGWLIYDRLSPEPHELVLIYPFYVGLGKLSGALGLTFEATFLAAGTGARLALLLAIYGFARSLTSDIAQRRLIFMLVPTASGLASVLGIASTLSGQPLPVSPSELSNPEVSTFLLLLTAPHLILSLALMLATGTVYTRAWNQQSTDPARSALLVTTVVGVLGLTNPFTLVPLCAVVALHAVVMIVMNPDIPRRCGLVSGATIIASAAPFVAYSALTFALDPFWGATYGRQNVTPTPPPLELLLGLGLTFPLAVLGAAGFARERTPARLFVLAWIVIAALLMYVPLGIQRRFAFGLQPMLAIVAAFALRDWWRTIRGPLPLLGTAARPVLTLILAQVLIGSSLATYMIMVEVAINPAASLREPTHPDADRAVFQPVALADATDWLTERMAPDDVVLGHALTGNYLAGRIPGRVYVGHWVASLNFEQKRLQSRWFYAAPLDDARMRFLHEAGIRYVVYGPHERAPFPPHDARLAPAYSADGIVVFVVASR